MSHIQAGPEECLRFDVLWYEAEFSTADPFYSLNGLMAFCNRTRAIQVALVAVVLLFLIYQLFSKPDSDSPSLYSHPKLRVTQWPKRTHGSLESRPSSTVGNDGKERNVYEQQQQHNNDGQPINNDFNAALKRHDGSASSAPNVVPGRNQAADLDGQHNNSEIKNVIQTLAKEPTKRTAALATVSEQYELNGDKSNRNVSSFVTPSPSSGRSNSHFSNVDNVGNSSGFNNVKSDTASIASNKSTHEPVNSVPMNATSASPAPEKLVAPFNMLAARLYDDSAGTREYLGSADDLSDKFTINSCPPIPPNLDGPIDVDLAFESLSAVEQRLASKLQPGGQYAPPNCTARNRVAIIVPYRDREQHLPIFLKNIHALLMKQQLEYGIYIVEQTAGSSFNRAKLMNIGFVEAMKQKNWECMVFHDIDLLPMDDRNLYTCPDQPRHMSVAVDTFCFKLPYNAIFGGVSAMTEKQFRMVNGFSNSFWGWGGEDDDMSNSYDKLATGAKRFDSDGLNSLHYQLVNLIRKPLYTWIHADISPDSS
uniref:Galactosyltransferase N-terminal domain-containing protein n=1 Tax=Anopheles culicifacies TaxID=139723 RepID=A0A182MW45_9DIPT